MKFPHWSKPFFLFVGIIFSVVAVALAFFLYTAVRSPKTEQLSSAQKPPTAQKTTSTFEASPTPDTKKNNPSVLGTTTPQLQVSKLYLLIQAHRENFNVPKLKIHPKLEASAQLKLADMIEKEYYRHTDEDDQSTWDFLQVAGYQYQRAGENLAFNIGSEWDIFQAWVQSPTHNKQMLDPGFTDMGIAIDCERITEPGYKCIVVAHFGKQ